MAADFCPHLDPDASGTERKRRETVCEGARERRGKILPEKRERRMHLDPDLYAQKERLADGVGVNGDTSLVYYVYG